MYYNIVHFVGYSIKKMVSAVYTFNAKSLYKIHPISFKF
jgi:hypothetical protein